MSRSVSAPSSVTNTSPCWNGFIVPGSTLRYGSSFCMATRMPRDRSRRPRLEAVKPLPSEEATPPVTKMCRVVKSDRPEDLYARSATGFYSTRRLSRPVRDSRGRPTPAVVRPVPGRCCCLLYTSDAADEEDSVDLGG